MRESSVTPELQEEILRRIGEGETLRQICREEHMPSFMSVYRLREADESFALRFARARDDGADAIAENIIEIADDGQNDWMERLGSDGQPIGWQLNGEHVQRSKLRIETRLKLLAKWFPQKYGERTAVDLNGTINVTISAVDDQL